MNELNLPWQLNADAIRDSTGRIVVDRMDISNEKAEHIVSSVNTYLKLLDRIEKLKARLAEAETPIDDVSCIQHGRRKAVKGR